MPLTFYEIGKLSRMVYDQKLASSLEKPALKRSKAQACPPPCKSMARQIRPSGAAAK